MSFSPIRIQYNSSQHTRSLGQQLSFRPRFQILVNQAIVVNGPVWREHLRKWITLSTDIEAKVSGQGVDVLDEY